MHLHFFVDWTGGDVIANGSIIVRLNHICFYKCTSFFGKLYSLLFSVFYKISYSFQQKWNPISIGRPRSTNFFTRCYIFFHHVFHDGYFLHSCFHPFMIFFDFHASYF